MIISILAEFIVAAIWWLIESINGGFRYLRESGYPILSLFLKWNTWMFLPFWLLYILFGEKFEGDIFYKNSPNWNKSEFIVERENIKGDGWLYTVSYETEENVMAHISIPWNYQIDFKEKSDPDYLIVTVSNPYGRVKSKTVYDRNGQVHNTLKTYSMLNPYKCSGALTILLAVIMNICLSIYAWLVEIPYYRPTKPEHYGIRPDNNVDMPLTEESI